MDQEETKKLVNITIDDQKIAVPPGTTVYTAAKMLGIELPIFCYQDRMPPFGACRVCLVEVEKMGKLQTSCTLVATEGMVVRTRSPQAIEGRKSILEFLLINHPLDCPICDRGGECPLQDQTLKYGPSESEFYEQKRKFKKAVPLGPVLMLDRERCIACARCTRFGDVITGDHALEFINRGYKTEVGTPDGKPVESKFIGNTIQICPVGALTSQVYRFRARPWDNDSQGSTCTLCPVGCSMIFDSRDGEIMRTRAGVDPDVNDMWLCDKGWFGYEFVSHPDRLKVPLIRRNGQLVETDMETALSVIAEKISQFKDAGRLAALGGNPLTVEENYLFQKLMREGAHVNHIDHRVGMPLAGADEEGIAPGMEISPGACEKLSYIYLLGVDITEEFPVLWLRLKHACNHGARIVFFGHYAPEVSHLFNESHLHRPGDELSVIDGLKPEILGHTDSGKPVAIFVGNQYLAVNERKAILKELLEIRKSHGNLSLNLLEGKENSLGAEYAGMHPEFGPRRLKIDKPGLNAHEIIRTIEKEGWDFLWVAGTNIAPKVGQETFTTIRSKLGFLVVQDLFLNETAKHADVVLPTRCYPEKEGTFINIEWRPRRLAVSKELPEGPLSDGEIFKRVGEKLSLSMNVDDDFLSTLKSDRIANPLPGEINAEKTIRDQNAPYQVALSTTLFDQGVRMKHNSQLSKLIKEPCVRMNPEDMKKNQLVDHREVTFRSNRKTFTVKVAADTRVAPGVFVVPLGFDTIPTAHFFVGSPIEIIKENHE